VGNNPNVPNHQPGASVCLTKDDHHPLAKVCCPDAFSLSYFRRLLGKALEQGMDLLPQ